MRTLLLCLICLFPLWMQAQDLKEDVLLDEIGKLKTRLKSERSRVNELQARVMLLETNSRALTDSLQAQVQSNLAIQAQNERALNLALEEFSKKYEEQNKTVEGVKAQLESQWQKQFLFYLVGLILLVVVLIWAVRYSSARAISQHKKSWDEFNDYILKKR